MNDQNPLTQTHAAHWDAKYRKAIRSSWTENPYVQRHVNYRMTGDHRTHWLNWLFTDFLPERPKRVLSIGCGDGSHELIVARNSYADYVYGFDASSVGIGLANEAVTEESLSAEFEVRLFDDFANDPPEEPFDIAIFAGSLHHVRNIEEMLFAVHNCVRPGGYVVVNEYVGPVFQLYDKIQVDLVNAILGILPPDLILDREFRLEIPKLKTIYENDPSEGVRAPLIPALLPRIFSPVRIRHMNGAILHPLFDGINSAVANVESPENESIFRNIIEIEEMLTERGILSSDFIFGIYRNDSI